MDKVLGKITKAEFGWGGYNGIMLGLTVYFEFSGGGIADNISWNGCEHTDRCKWTYEEQKAALGAIVLRVGDILAQAKVSNVSDLVGKPVEVTIENRQLVEWRILEEVL